MRNYFVTAAIGAVLLAIPSVAIAQDPATGAAVGATGSSKTSNSLKNPTQR